MWNVRRSSSSNLFIYLIDLIREHKPIILILIEAHHPDHTVKLIQDNYGFSNYKFVEPMYRRGGMWYFWKHPVNTIDFISTEPSPFHSLLTMAPDQPEVLLIALHAPSTSSQRPPFWNRMATDLPLITLGKTLTIALHDNGRNIMLQCLLHSPFAPLGFHIFRLHTSHVLVDNYPPNRPCAVSNCSSHPVTPFTQFCTIVIHLHNTRTWWLPDKRRHDNARLQLLLQF
ncbi:hypothetical protein Cgig2_024169 [Carnegiea gigantea]|uniref:Endonuclease/exonuclease/phosphatase domain-containing protein n=1 Tax=Carnegiea gigantea TaxID=171969 RepID=A0A9Q1KAB1_9CARY|nr:hypothetical protein Cgig2_024169 [Carnegiea gigantea]